MVHILRDSERPRTLPLRSDGAGAGGGEGTGRARGEGTDPGCLLHGLAAIDGIRWIRLLYCYPEEITDELIDTIAAEPKVLHYLDMPIQHASDDVLRRMGRHTTRKDLEEVIGKIRAKIPDCCLRTTLITGLFQGGRDACREDEASD